MGRKPKVQYKPRPGSILTPKQANAYGQIIANLTRMNGGEVTPEIVVSDARSIKSPMHDYFDWDNTKAAAKWRLHQARNLIGAIVEVVVVEGERYNQRSFYSVKNINKEKTYVALHTALTVPDYIEQLLDRGIDQLHNIQITLKMLKHKKKELAK